MKLRPTLDRVLVRRQESDTKSEGGIIIPDMAREKPQRGKVVAVGPGKRLENGTYAQMPFQVGSTVLFSRFGGNEVQGEDEMLILREDDILGVLE